MGNGYRFLEVGEVKRIDDEVLSGSLWSVLAWVDGITKVVESEKGKYRRPTAQDHYATPTDKIVEHALDATANAPDEWLEFEESPISTYMARIKCKGDRFAIIELEDGTEDVAHLNDISGKSKKSSKSDDIRSQVLGILRSTNSFDEIVDRVLSWHQASLQDKSDEWPSETGEWDGEILNGKFGPNASFEKYRMLYKGEFCLVYTSESHVECSGRFDECAFRSIETPAQAEERERGEVVEKWRNSPYRKERFHMIDDPKKFGEFYDWLKSTDQLKDKSDD